jgi:transcriptional regulator NrdR family protein
MSGADVGLADMLSRAMDNIERAMSACKCYNKRLGANKTDDINAIVTGMDFSAPLRLLSKFFDDVVAHLVAQLSSKDMNEQQLQNLIANVNHSLSASEGSGEIPTTVCLKLLMNKGMDHDTAISLQTAVFTF